MLVDAFVRFAHGLFDIVEAPYVELLERVGYVERQFDALVFRKTRKYVRRRDHFADFRRKLVFESLGRRDAVECFDCVGVRDDESHIRLLEAYFVIRDLLYLHLLQSVLLREHFVFRFAHIDDRIGKITVCRSLVFDEDIAYVLRGRAVRGGQVAAEKRADRQRFVERFDELSARLRQRIGFRTCQIETQKGPAPDKVCEN